MTSYASGVPCPACGHWLTEVREIPGTSLIPDLIPADGVFVWRFVCSDCRHTWDGPWDPSRKILLSDSRF